MVRTLLLMTLSFLLLACHEGQHETAVENEAPIPVAADALAKMAEADQFDGTVDHLVAKCAACALQMDGKPEYGIKLGDYTMHFCSEACRKNYSKDPESKLAQLTVPQPTAAE